MAGFFGFFDPTKPGAGVDKDAPRKHPVYLFIELVGRKIWQLILINLIYFVMLLPILTAIYAVLYGYIFTSLSQSGVSDSLTEIGANLSGATLPLLPGFLLSVAQLIPVWVSAILLVASIILYGPATCAMSYMLFKFTREQHAWSSDFFDKFKQNFKQGLALGLIDIVLLCLFVFNITYRGDGMISMMGVIRYVSWVLLIIYLCMHNYIFVLAVNFRFTVSQILKNAFFFAILGWWRNILALVLNTALIVLMLFLWQFVELALLPLLLLSLTGFLSVFTSYPIVKKYLLDPQATANENG